MTDDAPKRIFISYNYKDRDTANRIAGLLRDERFAVWIDVSEISPGDHIAQTISEALVATDYYLLLISENSATSQWVKRELSWAFELSQTEKLTLVPLILDDAPVPLELRGLLYVDFRASFKDGFKHLVEFFRGQFSTVAELEHRRPLRKSVSADEVRRKSCESKLFELGLGELRYLIAAKMSRNQIEVLWFDVFLRRMSDETSAFDVSLCSVELVDRARREDRLVELIATVCRNVPYL